VVEQEWAHYAAEARLRADREDVAEQEVLGVQILVDLGEGPPVHPSSPSSVLFWGREETSSPSDHRVITERE
jgi:hypothetical protein